jgi:hypothetical protein
MGALTVLELTTARDNLVRALARGVTVVIDQNGEQVRYAGPDAMQRALAILEARISAMQSGAAVNTVRFCTTKESSQ